MSTVLIDLSGRYSSAFGFVAKNVIGRTGFNPYLFGQYFEKDAVFKDNTLKSKFEDVTLKYKLHKLNFSSFPFVNAVKAPFHVPFTPNEEPPISNIVAPPPLISFSRKKKLVVTELNDGDAEVIERWNTKSWDIRMRGLLVDMNEHSYPSDLVRKIHKLFEHNDTVEVSGTQFFEKDINSIYIKDIDITGVVGYQDTVQYTIVASSIRDVNFTLTNP
jgi:hypothetical protein